MEIGQNIFYALFKLHKQVGRSFTKTAPTITFASIAQQLRILARLLSPVEFELSALKSGQGTAVNVLFYPEEIHLLGDSPHLTHNALVYRTAFLVCSAELKYKAALKPTLLERELALLLSVPGIRKRLQKQFPGTETLAVELSPLLLKERSRKNESTAILSPCETLIRTLLGAPLPADLPKHIRSWVTRAATFEVESGEELEKTARLFATELNALMPRSTHVAASGTLLWGLVTTGERPVHAIELPQGLSLRGDAQYEAKLDKSVERKTVEVKKESNPLFHSFEKTETVEDFQGETAQAEATEVLSDEEEALKDLALGHVIRTTESTQGLLKGELIGEGIAFLVDSDTEITQTLHRYPEWNWKTRSYRENWCTVVEEMPRVEAADKLRGREVTRRYRSEIKEIRQQLMLLFSTRTVRNRQLDGPDIDVEALVERHADLKAGHTPHERLYLSERKKLRDLAILLLFDTSLSTDGWIDARRILDIEIDSILVLSEVFEGLLDDEISVASFNSNTRHSCNFTLLKKFDETWERMRSVSSLIEPDGYTRIGPAIRHATSLLKARDARQKFLILVTDGKPTDYDQYEGIYGREDVTQAIREGKQHQVKTFALAIEKEAKQSLARMFGVGCYRILPRTSLLPSSMAEMFVRLIQE